MYFTLTIVNFGNYWEHVDRIGGRPREAIDQKPSVLTRR